MYTQTTHNITISVEPVYLEDESSPVDNQYFWAYHITIENNGAEIVQLRSRTWHITDSMGRTQEIHGEGVVGQQPVLEPGQSYKYTSGAPLPTPWGTMAGSYTMRAEDGKLFDVAIPAFFLDCPNLKPVLH